MGRLGGGGDMRKSLQWGECLGRVLQGRYKELAARNHKPCEKTYVYSSSCETKPCLHLLKANLHALVQEWKKVQKCMGIRSLMKALRAPLVVSLQFWAYISWRGKYDACSWVTWKVALSIYYTWKCSNTSIIFTEQHLFGFDYTFCQCQLVQEMTQEEYMSQTFFCGQKRPSSRRVRVFFLESKIMHATALSWSSSQFDSWHGITSDTFEILFMHCQQSWQIIRIVLGSLT